MHTRVRSWISFIMHPRMLNKWVLQIAYSSCFGYGIISLSVKSTSLREGLLLWAALLSWLKDSLTHSHTYLNTSSISLTITRAYPFQEVLQTQYHGETGVNSTGAMLFYHTLNSVPLYCVSVQYRGMKITNYVIATFKILYGRFFPSVYRWTSFIGNPSQQRIMFTMGFFRSTVLDISKAIQF